MRCASGHAYDLARQGYLNLLGRSAPANADTPSMLAAREHVLSSGAYEPLADALTDAAAGAQSVLDVGAGTGYYLAHLMDRGAVRGVALDVSVAACRRAARAHERLGAWWRMPGPNSRWATADSTRCSARSHPATRPSSPGC